MIGDQVEDLESAEREDITIIPDQIAAVDVNPRSLKVPGTAVVQAAEQGGCDLVLLSHIES
jgi:hypothetical protein